MRKRNWYKLSAALLVMVSGVVLVLQTKVGLAVKKEQSSFSKSVKKLQEGETFIFKVQGVKNNEKSVQWSTSNKKIAKVSKGGKVTAVKAGTVTIKAVIKRSGKSVSQKLKITKKEVDSNEEDMKQGETILNPILDGDEFNTDQGGQDSSKNYEDLEVENKFITNLSKTVTAEPVGFDDFAFLEYKDMNKFNYSVFQKAVARGEENPVVSPLSAYLALQLAAEGAEGETKQQFDTLLGTDMISARIDHLMEDLLDVSGSTKLAIADSVWLDDQLSTNVSWLSRMVSVYNAEIYQADLCTDMARTGMNHWVSNHTKGLIPTLFEQNLSEDARLVLMNTIYLKAKWQYLFEHNNTYKRDFTNENKKKVQTDFMNDYRVHRRYFKTEEADGVVLPYNDGKLAMLAIRPQAGQTARELAQSLTEKKIADYLEHTKDTYMNLHLPKFTIEYSLDMNQILSDMGLTDAFDEIKADFSGIGKTKGNPDNDLYISQVLQKVKVQVDEEGTEAAAVTEITMEAGSAMMPQEEEPIEVDFNEPFVYVIVHTDVVPANLEEKEKINMPLFMGVVTEFVDMM